MNASLPACFTCGSPASFLPAFLHYSASAGRGLPADLLYVEPSQLQPKVAPISDGALSSALPWLASRTLPPSTSISPPPTRAPPPLGMQLQPTPTHPQASSYLQALPTRTANPTARPTEVVRRRLVQGERGSQVSEIVEVRQVQELWEGE